MAGGSVHLVAFGVAFIAHMIVNRALKSYFDTSHPDVKIIGQLAADARFDHPE